MHIIAGLGNPGPTYAGTRHNAGFKVIDTICRRLGIESGGVRFKARTAEGVYRGEKFLLLKPRTFMNLSGESVLSCLNTLRLAPENLIVIHDDLDLVEGRVLVKTRGADGGHRGIRSIMELLGTGDFARIRVGIGRPPAGIDPVDWVLTAWEAPELELMEAAFDRAAQAALTAIAEGVVIAMNRFNREPKAVKEKEEAEKTREDSTD